MREFCSKIVLYILGGILIYMLVWHLIFSYPRAFNKDFKGVLFRCGSSNTRFEEKVTIHFEGKLSKNILFGHKFKGKVQINDTVLPEHIDELELKFSPSPGYQTVDLGYFYYDDTTDEMQHYLYGYLVTDNDFDNLMIQIPEKTSGEGKSWSGTDGLTIGAPASSRYNALTICNGLLSDVTCYSLE